MTSTNLHPADTLTIETRASLALRRERLDKPFHEIYYYARSTTIFDAWYALMTEHPVCRADSLTTTRRPSA